MHNQRQLERHSQFGGATWLPPPSLTSSAFPPSIHRYAHTQPVNGVAFLTSDGSRLASSDTDGGIRLWRVQADGPPRLHQGHALDTGNCIDSLAVSRSAACLATAAGEKTSIYDTVTCKCLRVLQHEAANSHSSFAFDSSGLYYVTGSSQGIRVWQRNMEDPIASINSPAATASIKGVQAAVFAPGSNHVVYAVDKVGGVAAWDLRSCSQRMSRSDEQSLHIRQRVTLAGSEGTQGRQAPSSLPRFVSSQEESLGGRSLTAGGEGGLPADNHAVLFCSRQTSAAQPEASEPLHEYIASRTESGSVYNLASQLFEYPFYGHSHCSPPLHIAVLSGGLHLLTSNSQSHRVWRIGGGGQVAMHAGDEAGNLSSAPAISACGLHVLSGTTDGRVQSWDTRIQLKRVGLPPFSEHCSDAKFDMHRSMAASLAVDIASNEWIASGGSDGSICIRC